MAKKVQRASRSHAPQVQARNLQESLARFDPAKHGGEFDFGPAVGKERFWLEGEENRENAAKNLSTRGPKCRVR